MKLPVLPAAKNIRGKRIFLRVDWNVPLAGSVGAEDSLKLKRTVETVNMLKERGAVVIVATHLGRPKGRDATLSTKRLLRILSVDHGLVMAHLDQALDTAKGLAAVQQIVTHAQPGAVFLLENVRFYKGEELNQAALAKAYASLADLFLNDAFASCHRSHASVVGVAKHLPSYAGPSLIEEVKGLEPLLSKAKKPFVAIVGGAKITTKIDVVKALLKIADRVCIGGAMATAFFAAQKKEIGKSYVEKEGVVVAKKMLKEKKISLPIDVVVADKIEPGVTARSVMVDDVKKKEAIGDIGPQTMQQWSEYIRNAKTIVWNGPVGVTEIASFSHGSRVMAQAIAARSRGSAYGVVGGGDTLPIVLASHMSEWYDHLSTGGGAMLEFLSKKGKLPGLSALMG